MTKLILTVEQLKKEVFKYFTEECDACPINFETFLHVIAFKYAVHEISRSFCDICQTNHEGPRCTLGDVE